MKETDAEKLMFRLFYIGSIVRESFICHEAGQNRSVWPQDDPPWGDFDMKNASLTTKRPETLKM